MPTSHVCAVTRNKAMHATTLHTIMNIHMYCMVKGHHLEIHFLKDRSSVQKFMKTGVERLIFMDYGVSIDNESVYKACGPFDKYHILVLPSVREGINWDRFRKETLKGSTEEVSQRGLEFDTVLDRKIGDSLYTIKSTDAVAWAMDVKPVDKKCRTPKGVSIKLSTESAEAFFSDMEKYGVKICALTSAKCTIHFTHECFGNILESAGVNLENGNPPS